MSKKSTTGEFISKSKLIHGDKYDYSKVEYVNNHSKVCIICPEHGEFWMRPKNHLQGNNCPKCSSTAKLSTEEFVNMAKKIHNDRYDYSKVNYINCQTKVCIICPEHGEFWQKPIYHLSGGGCNRCYGNCRKTTEEFIEQSKKIHNNKYDYSKVEYKNNSTKVCIICKKHGEFWQIPTSHLNGEGCPMCNHSKLENEVKENIIGLTPQKTFEWLKNKNTMRLDFFLNNKNIAIECQGEQHFKIFEYFGGDVNDFQQRLERDNLKYQLCKEHNIEVIYYFPKEFLKYENHFYDDKKCFHTIDDLKKYLDTKIL